MAVSQQHILERIEDTGTQVGSLIRDHCRRQLQQWANLESAVEHSLEDVGLLLRPFLLRISYEAGGKSFDDVLGLAGGIELIQISTLVIDDVLDKSSMRNGRPSIFESWGTGRAITCGAVIASKGMALICDCLRSHGNFKNPLSVMELIACTHGDIYVGQFMDLDSEANIKVSEEKYLETIGKTTASFIGAPLAIGAMLWDAPSNQISILEEVGLRLGMAYQLRDDVTDIIGDSECTGKPRAIDIYDRKMRLPVVNALTCLNSQKRERLIELFETPRDLTNSDVEEIIHLLECAGSIEYTVNKTKQFCSEADGLTNRLSPRMGVLAEHLRAVSTLISFFGNGWD